MATRPLIPVGAARPPDFTEETDLCLGRFGAKIIFATDGEWLGVMMSAVWRRGAIVVVVVVMMMMRMMMVARFPLLTS